MVEVATDAELEVSSSVTVRAEVGASRSGGTERRWQTAMPQGQVVGGHRTRSPPGLVVTTTGNCCDGPSRARSIGHLDCGCGDSDGTFDLEVEPVREPLDRTTAAVVDNEVVVAGVGTGVEEARGVEPFPDQRCEVVEALRARELGQ